MNKKSIILGIIAMLLLQSFVVAISIADPGPDYDLLIITPEDFEDELEPLKTFKDATGRSTVIVTLEDIYPSYSGDDEAEDIKLCIAEYEDVHNVKYVLLVGDVDLLPMRYFYLKRENATHVGWLQYYLTDHYYADLYDSGGGFCSWDDDDDGIYGEIFDGDNDGDYTNTDGIDHVFDVVVGRIPVDSDVEVERYVTKVINYETNVSFDDAWFKNILLVTGTGHWVYPALPTHWDTDENNATGAEMGTAGFSNVKLYHYNPPGPTYPNPANINANLNAGAGFLNVISHGCEVSWGVYDVRTDMTGLTNQDKLTIVYSFGCSTAKVGPIVAADPYIDTSGILRDYGTTYESSYYPHPKSTWVEPAEPDALQDATTDIHCMPEYWNFHYDTGAVAFVGSTAETSGAMGSPVMQYFYKSIATDGKRVLGDIWNSVSDKVLSGGHGIGSDWDHSRRWLYINVFGDPTLVIGGLDDKPPETSITTGSPKHIAGGTTYVTSATTFTLTATDDFGIDTTYYLYYPISSPSSSWSPGTSFTITGDDGDYIIWYYSEDTGGNIDYPIKSKLVTLDNSAPTTTHSIGSPKYPSGGDTYITSDTYITLTASDLYSGVASTEYKIDGGSWTPYITPFQVLGADGAHTIYYRSTDNLGTTEETKDTEVILDNTPPETTICIGDPKYPSGGDTYVTSLTDLTLSATDAGSGVQYSEYRINGGGWTLYTGAFQLIGPDGPYLVEYRSVDNLGNTEETQSEDLILDNTPPEVNIEIPEDGDYVYGDITIEITATDEGSGVHHVEYSLDNGITWIPAAYDLGKGRWVGSWDTTAFSEGAHTPLARAEDNVGNVGYDDTPPTVTVVYLDYDIEFSDSKWNTIGDFTVIFNERKPGNYKVSTNPGSMYEIITITNTGTLVTLPELILDIMIPLETDFLGAGEEAFRQHGAKSIHVYLNGVDVTPPGKWQPDLDNLNVMQALAPGDTIQVYVHYEYAFKGEIYTDPDDVTTWPGEDYLFETDILSALGPSWTNTLTAIPMID